MGVCWVTAEFAVGFGGAETPQISAVTLQISHGNHDIFKVTGWLVTANLAGNIGTPDFDVFPGRLCGQQISERLLGNSWIMNLGDYLCLLIDRCEKQLSPLQYAKLLYDFGNACHADDWEYISNCVMSSLKHNDDYKGFYTKFKEMYGEICDSDWFKKSIFSLFEKLFIVQYCNVNYFFEFFIENTYLLKIAWNPKGTYNLIACYVDLKFSWNSGYQNFS